MAAHLESRHFRKNPSGFSPAAELFAGLVIFKQQRPNPKQESAQHAVAPAPQRSGSFEVELSAMLNRAAATLKQYLPSPSH
jgi:hypothetical protein